MINPVFDVYIFFMHVLNNKKYYMHVKRVSLNQNSLMNKMIVENALKLDFERKFKTFLAKYSFSIEGCLLSIKLQRLIQKIGKNLFDS